MSRQAFLNRVRSLFNIDRDRLPELDATEWARFRDDPVRFFMRANDAHAAAIWREVEYRQPKVATVVLQHLGTRDAPGPWEIDTIENEDGHGRFNSYQVFDANGNRLFDSLNADAGSLEDDRDGEGGSCWDEALAVAAEVDAGDRADGDERRYQERRDERWQERAS